MGDLPPFNRNPYNGYINPYYWVDDHPLLYGNNGSLDPGTYIFPQIMTNHSLISSQALTVWNAKVLFFPLKYNKHVLYHLLFFTSQSSCHMSYISALFLFEMVFFFTFFFLSLCCPFRISDFFQQILGTPTVGNGATRGKRWVPCAPGSNPSFTWQSSPLRKTEGAKGFSGRWDFFRHLENIRNS